MIISVITATYNAGSTIAQCLQSVPDFAEHIIIDGSSTDNTLDVVKHISPHSRILSEPDKGIYDAMNKGIRFSSGDVIGILNADDFYANDRVLEKVSKVFEDASVEACYGDLVYVKEQGKSYEERDTSLITQNFQLVRYWKSGPFEANKFYSGWMPPHPTFFVRRSVYEKYGLFNLDLGSAADYELMLRFLLRHRIKVAYIPEVLVKMRVGGVSNANLANRLRANQMDRKAWEVNGLKPYPWTLWMKPLRKIPQWWQRPPQNQF